MTQVTVLGGTGKTGRVIVRNLTEAGLAVRAVSRSTLLRFDWRDETTWPACLQGADAVYVIPDESHQGVDRLRRFLEISGSAGVGRVVLLSARDWIDIHLEDGLARERIVRESGLEWSILQPAWFAQNFDTSEYFTAGIRQGRILHSSDGGRCPFVDVRDIAAVATAALSEPGHHGKEYPISGPVAITMDEVAQAIGAALAREIIAVEVEPEEYERHLVGLGYGPESIHVITYLDRAMRAGELDYISDGLQAATGQAPTPFAGYAKDYAASPGWSRG